MRTHNTHAVNNVVYVFFVIRTTTRARELVSVSAIHSKKKHNFRFVDRKHDRATASPY